MLKYCDKNREMFNGLLLRAWWSEENLFRQPPKFWWASTVQCDLERNDYFCYGTIYMYMYGSRKEAKINVEA